MQGQKTGGRRGFTLVELLVAIGIIALLATLAFFVGGAMFRADQAQRGGASVASTIQIARQMALRDRINYGLRLVPNATPSPFYTRPNPPFPIYDFAGLEYIQQPPDYVQNAYMAGPPPSPMPPVPPNLIEFAQPLDGGLGPTPPSSLTEPIQVPIVLQKLWPVQVGDVLKIDHKPDPFLIVDLYTQRIPMSANLRWFVRTASNPNPLSSFYLNTFRIMRAARPVPGEEMIKLPDNVIIDGVFSKVGTSSNAFAPNPSSPYVVVPSVLGDPITERVDVLFSPARGVVGSASGSGKIILWVRNREAVPTIQPNGAILAHPSKEQVLVVIYTRTGTIASYPVDNSGQPDPNFGGLLNPYRFINDPRATGQ